MKLLFVGGCFLYRLEGRAGMSPEGVYGHSCVCVCVGGVCECEKLASRNSRSELAGVPTVGANWVVRVT